MIKQFYLTCTALFIVSSVFAQPGITGCTDPAAYNYNSLAEVEDGTCCYTNYVTTSAGLEMWSVSFENPENYQIIYPGQTEGVCLPDGCYNVYLQSNNFVFEDLEVYLNGTLLTTISGNTLQQTGGAFNLSIGLSVDGCTDPGACNYNAAATCNDGSCNYDCLGCTDPNADNYDPDATIDNGTCCTESLTLNASGDFDWVVFSLDGTNSQFGSYPANNTICMTNGCSAIDIYPYNPDVVINWELVDEVGNVIASGTTINWGYSYAFGVNVITGCIDSQACNYNAEANCGDYNACDYSCIGCTDPEAPNYNPDATIDNGSCCTDDWFTVDSDQPGFWYAYDQSGSFYTSGHFPESAGFCMGNQCFWFVFYADNIETSLSVSLYMNGELLASGVSDPLTGSLQMLIENGTISGCMDGTACNYDPEATCADYYICDYSCYGCTDPNAPNYDPGSTADDGSCCYDAWYTITLSSPGYWSTSSWVDNNYGFGHYPEDNGFCVGATCFQFYAWADDGSALDYTITGPDGVVVVSGTYNYYEGVITVSSDEFVTGCIDTWACNYNPEATCGDYTSCDYSCYGCTDPTAPNYDPEATIDNNSCCYGSWYNVTTSSPAWWYVSSDSFLPVGNWSYYDNEGFCASVSCFSFFIYPLGNEPVEYSVTDSQGNIVAEGTGFPGGYNISSISITDEVAGCLDMSACNYNADATCNDGSCNYYCGGCTDPDAMNYNPEAQYDDGTCFYNAVPPNMGMAMIPDEDNNQFYVLMSMLETGNGAPYVLRSDFDENYLMIDEAGEYLAGPYPCDTPVAFELQSMPAGLATYLNAELAGQCALISNTEIYTVESGINIYPNPNNGTFTISGLQGEPATLRIHDLSGRLIMEQLVTTASGQVPMNISALPNGIYQVSVVTGEEIRTEKMVVQK